MAAGGVLLIDGDHVLIVWRARLPVVPPGPTPSPSTTKGCIKVVTGTGDYADGPVTVYVDEGVGFEAATTINKEYGEGATVLIKCYDNLKAVRMQNIGDNKWIGSVAFARTLTGPFEAGSCTTSCTKQGSTSRISLAGDGDPSDSATAMCQYSKMCDINVKLKDTTGVHRLTLPPTHANSLASAGHLHSP